MHRDKKYFDITAQDIEILNYNLEFGQKWPNCEDAFLSVLLLISLILAWIGAFLPHTHMLANRKTRNTKTGNCLPATEQLTCLIKNTFSDRIGISNIFLIFSCSFDPGGGGEGQVLGISPKNTHLTTAFARC